MVRPSATGDIGLHASAEREPLHEVRVIDVDLCEPDFLKDCELKYTTQAECLLQALFDHKSLRVRR